jgi:D-arabinose 1-dehydrogenase-like Zn-dependent alcohol dehydrogenase
MRAVRFVGVGQPAQITDVAKPTPGPGQVVIKIGGAGMCHSDLHVMEEGLGLASPFTLGHENAGWIAQLGAGVIGFKEGDAVAVYGPWGCGYCRPCQLSMENYCDNWAKQRVDDSRLGRGASRFSSRQHAVWLRAEHSLLGPRIELMEVISMAREGRIHTETTEFPLEQAVEVYDRLKRGQIKGRAVLVPESS